MLSSETFSALVQALAADDAVLAIGKSGGDARPLPEESDIDLFIICRGIAAAEQRAKIVLQMGAAVNDSKISDSHDLYWGSCDYLQLMGQEVYLMYFTAEEIEQEIDATLGGSRLNREGGCFYPTGRCATFLTMHILYDADGFLHGLQEKLAVYPPALARRMMAHHLPLIQDEEDFTRAIRRGDVLFYHFTLEIALDHFLQVLFALNRCYLPSRKRTLAYIADFTLKPKDCGGRLLQAVELGAQADTLARSYEIWSGLCQDLRHLRSGEDAANCCAK